MAKKIKFPLEMDNEVRVRTLDELRDNFDLNKVVGYFLNGKLMGWLEDRYYETECVQLDKNDIQLYEKLCGILGVEYQVQEEVDLEEIELRNQNIAKLKQYTDDASILDKVDIVAFNQEDLAILIDQGERVIYLFENQFTIPLKFSNKEYIGIGKVEVVIPSKDKVDFVKLGIKFNNVQFNSEYTSLIQNTPEELYNIAYEAVNEQNYTKALEYYKKAVDLGNIRAIADIGDLYYYGRGVERNFQKSIEWYKKAADLGNGYANYLLGWQYQYGQGVNQDYQIAMEWYKKATELNNDNAMTKMGSFYHYGYGVENNYQMAMEWYKKAAEMENADAMSNIGDLYYNGQGIEKDYQASIEWHKKAADLGNNYANYILGWQYEFGQGTDKNMQLAQAYYKEASDGGHSNTNLTYDCTYRYGYNLLFFYSDIDAGMKWFREHYSNHGNKLIDYIDSIISNVRNFQKGYACSVWLYFDSSVWDTTKNEINSVVKKAVQQCRVNITEQLDNRISRYCSEINSRYLLFLSANAIIGNLDNTIFSNRNSLIKDIENQLSSIKNNFSVPDPTEAALSGLEFREGYSAGGLFSTRTYSLNNEEKIKNLIINAINSSLIPQEEYIYNYTKNIIDGWADDLERIKRNLG